MKEFISRGDDSEYSDPYAAGVDIFDPEAAKKLEAKMQAALEEEKQELLRQIAEGNIPPVPAEFKIAIAAAAERRRADNSGELSDAI